MNRRASLVLLAASAGVVALATAAAFLGAGLAAADWGAPLDAPTGCLHGGAGEQGLRPPQFAPSFAAPDADGNVWKLETALADGPVVLVFYAGAHCTHCTQELRALAAAGAEFRRRGTTIAAVSPDAGELSRQRLGSLGFAVLSDPDRVIAQRYGAVRPSGAGRAEAWTHATFLIGRDGRVRWAYRGGEPFTDHRLLLEQVDRLAGGQLNQSAKPQN